LLSLPTVLHRSLQGQQGTEYMPTAPATPLSHGRPVVRDPAAFNWVGAATGPLAPSTTRGK